MTAFAFIGLIATVAVLACAQTERCPSCGCDPRYPTGVHIVDCGSNHD